MKQLLSIILLCAVFVFAQSGFSLNSSGIHVPSARTLSPGDLFVIGGFEMANSSKPASIEGFLVDEHGEKHELTKDSPSNTILGYVGYGILDYLEVGLNLNVHYDGNALVIEVKHTPKDLSLKGLTIGLDAGHGGELPGAVSATGIKESDVNLRIVNEIRKLLVKKGAKVVLSRVGDVNLSMPERKKIFLDGNIDLLLSIHNNAGGSPFTPMGTSTYYKHITNRDLAATLLKHMLELGVPNFGLTGNFNFSLNAPTEYPNALVECLFMSSLPEEEMLADPATHQRIAEKVVAGLEEYLQTVSEACGRTTSNSNKKGKK